jgi:hypothetical protein
MDALDLSMDENPSVIAFAILSNYIPAKTGVGGGGGLGPHAPPPTPRLSLQVGGNRPNAITLSSICARFAIKRASCDPAWDW